VPLLTGIATGGSGKLPARQEGITVSRTGVLITAFGENPDGKGNILRLWEQAGISGNCKVTLHHLPAVKAVIPIDLRGNKTGAAIAVKNGVFNFHLSKYTPASFLLIR
jgi:hypothetical protein